MQQLLQLAKACPLLSSACVQWSAVTTVVHTPFQVHSTFRICSHKSFLLYTAGNLRIVFVDYRTLFPIFCACCFPFLLSKHSIAFVLLSYCNQYNVGMCRVFSSLSGKAPPYLAYDIHLVSEGARRRLWSSTDRSCAVPHTHNRFGDRSFAAAGPRVWNSLPAHLRDEDITYNSFRRELKKTYWF